MHECKVCGQVFAFANGLGCHQTTQAHYPPAPPTAREAWTDLLADPHDPVLRAVFCAALDRYDRTLWV